MPGPSIWSNWSDIEPGVACVGRRCFAQDPWRLSGCRHRSSRSSRWLVRGAGPTPRRSRTVSRLCIMLRPHTTDVHGSSQIEVVGRLLIAHFNRGRNRARPNGDPANLSTESGVRNLLGGDWLRWRTCLVHRAADRSRFFAHGIVAVQGRLHRIESPRNVSSIIRSQASRVSRIARNGESGSASVLNGVRCWRLISDGSATSVRGSSMCGVTTPSAIQSVGARRLQSGWLLQSGLGFQTSRRSPSADTRRYWFPTGCAKSRSALAVRCSRTQHSSTTVGRIHASDVVVHEMESSVVTPACRG